MSRVKQAWVLCMVLFITSCNKTVYEIASSEHNTSTDNDNAQPFLNTIEYSNLVDRETQLEVKENLVHAGVKEEAVDNFLDQVSLFNQIIGDVGLVQKGFETSKDLTPDYDIVKIHNKWQAQYPVFPGHNCRITTFGMLEDFVSIQHPEKQNSNNLFIDKDALATSPKKIFTEEETNAFMALFSKIPTENHKDISQHLKVVQTHWKEKGISFIHDGDKDKASFIFVFFHAAFAPDDSNLFIGHTGVLVPTSNHQLLFIEKLAFEEPYQVLKFKNRTALNDYLMNRYDVEWGQPSAKPIILENDELLEGYRPNIHNIEGKDR